MSSATHQSRISDSVGLDFTMSLTSELNAFRLNLRCVHRLERILQPHFSGETTLNFSARSLRNCAGANQHDRIKRDLVFIRDSLADARDDLLDVESAPMSAFHLLHQHDSLPSIREHGEGGSAVAPQGRMAVVHRLLDILRVVIHAAHDDHVLAATGDEQFSGLINEAKITGAQPRPVVLIALDARLKRRPGGLRILPIPLADMRTAQPYFADAIRGQPASRLHIHDGHPLPRNVFSAADHPKRVVPAGRGGNLIASERFDANSADHRAGASVPRRDTDGRFGHSVLRMHRTGIESIGAERRAKAIEGLSPYRFSAVESHLPA